jgi:hypothetical protein
VGVQEPDPETLEVANVLLSFSKGNTQRGGYNHKRSKTPRNSKTEAVQETRMFKIEGVLIKK